MLMNKAMMRAAAISMLMLFLIAVCHANEDIIEYAGAQKANSLSGIITDGCSYSAGHGSGGV
jgi:hypothetical protein